MTTLREDARRALTARRERVLATPAPLAAPIVWTLGVTGLTTLLLLLLGVGPVTLAVALSAELLVAAVAARRTLASGLAGFVLWLARPYRPHERILLEAPEQGGEIEAELLRVGLINTTLDADGDVLVVANTRLLRK